MVKELGVHSRGAPPIRLPRFPDGAKDFLYVPTGNGMAEDALNPCAHLLVCLRKDTGKVINGRTIRSAGICGHQRVHWLSRPSGRGRVIHPQGDGWVRSFDAETGNWCGSSTAAR